MQAVAGLCLLVSCVAGAVLGIRLLLAWRRTRQAPELAIGVTAASLAVSGAVLGFLAALEHRAQEPTLVALYMAGLFGVGLSATALTVGFWRIFRPREAWAGGLCVAAGAALLAWWGLSLAAGNSGLRGEGGARALLFYSARVWIYSWGSVECFRFWGMMERRVGLGLADALTAHRFWLWGVSSAGQLVSTAVTAYATYVARANPLAWAPSLLLTSVLGTASALAMWWAFYPPVWYQRMALARGAGGDPATPMR